MSIDHRRGAAFAPGDLTNTSAPGGTSAKTSEPTSRLYTGLATLGAVCTHAGHGVSREGFDAEWRGVDLLTVDGDMVNRCEAFDEADLDAAIARFEELSQPAPRLENAASQVFEQASWRALRPATGTPWPRSWPTIFQRRSPGWWAPRINWARCRGRGFAGGRRPRLHAYDVSVIAIRGERLVLARVRISAATPRRFNDDALNVVEIDTDDRIAAVVVFDLDDFDAAIAELDARYLAGEAAAHAHTWSVVAGVLCRDSTGTNSPRLRRTG